MIIGLVTFFFFRKLVFVQLQSLTLFGAQKVFRIDSSRAVILFAPMVAGWFLRFPR